MMNKMLLFSAFLFVLMSDSPRKTEVVLSDDDYELVFSDEFNLPNGSQPDSKIWSRKTRNPDQCNRWNSDSEKVVFIKNGHLVCRAIPNRSEPNDTARMLTGSIWTFGKYNVTYGRIEVRMKTNNKVGNFPAAWLKWQPRNWTTDPYAEIDIVEMFGNMGSANHNIHSQLTVKNPKHGQKNSFRVPLDVTKWHVYAIEWTPTYVTWTIDGKPVGTYRKSTDPKLLREGQWTFDKPCYIVLNQSVGDGSIKGIGRYKKTTYETQFDYIRIYQKVKRN